MIYLAVWMAGPACFALGYFVGRNYR